MHLFSQVTDFLLFIGKLMITAGMCALAFYVLSEEVKNEQIGGIKVPVLNYTVVPILLIGFGTYFIASIFFGVYAMAVDTLFLCFCKFQFYYRGLS
jgi:choline transporter-like protein 2/4/5